MMYGKWLLMPEEKTIISWILSYLHKMNIFLAYSY